LTAGTPPTKGAAAREQRPIFPGLGTVQYAFTTRPAPTLYNYRPTLPSPPNPSPPPGCCQTSKFSLLGLFPHACHLERHRSRNPVCSPSFCLLPLKEIAGPRQLEIESRRDPARGFILPSSFETGNSQPNSIRATASSVLPSH
jgi:hypothetical protein